MNISHKTTSTGDKPVKLCVGLGAATSLQAWTAMQSGQATPPHAFKLEPLQLFRWTSVLTVMGRIENLKLHWGGQLHCNLRLSIGDLAVAANRDSLLLDVRNGTWVRAKLLLRRGLADLAEHSMRMLSASVVKVLDGDPTTAWTPTVPHYRTAHMRRLRLLLSQLGSGMQATFMALMVNDQLQQRFFSRIAAMDHHCYAGGLFDCSVQAAELAYQQEHLSQRERGIAALVCLLFDLGKVSDELYRSDRMRCDTGLEPHPNTARLLRRELDTVAHFDPALVESVRSLLAPCDWTEWLAAPGITPTLKQCVHQALRDAWAFDQPAKDFLTDIGEKK